MSRWPWVKTSLAPGSKVVVDYLDRAGLLPELAKLGFDVVGLGCTACIGNSGPLPPPPAGLGPRRRARAGAGVGAVGQPQLRGADQPRRAHELPGVAAAGGGL